MYKSVLFVAFFLLFQGCGNPSLQNQSKRLDVVYDGDLARLDFYLQPGSNSTHWGGTASKKLKNDILEKYFTGSKNNIYKVEARAKTWKYGCRDTGKMIRTVRFYGSLVYLIKTIRPDKKVIYTSPAIKFAQEITEEGECKNKRYGSMEHNIISDTTKIFGLSISSDENKVVASEIAKIYKRLNKVSKSNSYYFRKFGNAYVGVIDGTLDMAGDVFDDKNWQGFAEGIQAANTRIAIEHAAEMQRRREIEARRLKASLKHTEAMIDANNRERERERDARVEREKKYSTKRVDREERAEKDRQRKERAEREERQREERADKERRQREKEFLAEKKKQEALAKEAEAKRLAAEERARKKKERENCTGKFESLGKASKGKCGYVYSDYTKNIHLDHNDYKVILLSSSEKGAKNDLKAALRDAATRKCKSEGYEFIVNEYTFNHYDFDWRTKRCIKKDGVKGYKCEGSASFSCGRYVGRGN